MKFSKNRRLGGVANVVVFWGCGIADLQLTGGAESDRLGIEELGETWINFGHLVKDLG